MRLGLSLPYTGSPRATGTALRNYCGAGIEIALVSEGYGYDAPSQIGHFATLAPGMHFATNIISVYTRSTGLIAMTAMTLDHLTNGRFTLGLGASGPRVVEEFHGTAFRSPISRTRQTVEHCRRIWRGERLDARSHPTPGLAVADTTPGLKILATPRHAIPVSIAAMGPRNVALAAEIAEDWAPYFFRPESYTSVWSQAVKAGTSLRSPELSPLTVTAVVPFAITTDPETALARWRPEFALYVGGMGTASQNFYFDLVCRMGFQREAEIVRANFQSGKRDDAAAAIPLELMMDCSLVGPVGYVTERVAAFADCGVTTLALKLADFANGDSVRMVDILRNAI